MNVAVIGATSAIAEATARRFAGAGTKLFLAARDDAKLRAVADDLRARGAEVFCHRADFSDLAAHDGVVAGARSQLGGLDVVLIAYGTLHDQKAIDRQPEAQVAAFELNATSVISIASRFANALEDQKSGTLAIIGSVAGDRGRRSNYVYGAAKAAVHAWCSGARGRLRQAGVSVVLIKPGWVASPMTSHLRRNSLFITAEAAGRAVHAAIMRRQPVVYVPPWWRWISLAVRLMPSAILDRLSF
jgi:decaprenylphospho-beta-D-erythro-pentofuranosid-2-ulose 2-reductase